ncbi:MAG: MarC family protein [Rhodospirillales bacterium]
MLEITLIAFTTFAATIGPFDVPITFLVITAGTPARERRRIAVKGASIAAVILIIFVLGGEILLQTLGITLAALRTAGGVLLFMLAVNLVYAKPTGATSTTKTETAEAIRSDDVSVFPLATPLIAGPGAMGAAILVSADAGEALGWEGRAIVIAAAVAVCALTCVLMIAAPLLQRLMGVTGLQVITRVIGVLLAALAVQFVFDGLKDSGLLG